MNGTSENIVIRDVKIIYFDFDIKIYFVNM